MLETWKAALKSTPPDSRWWDWHRRKFPGDPSTIWKHDSDLYAMSIMNNRDLRFWIASYPRDKSSLSIVSWTLVTGVPPLPSAVQKRFFVALMEGATLNVSHQQKTKTK